MRAARRHLGLVWPGLGLLGSVACAGGATHLLNRRPIPWWWRLPGLHGHSAAWHLFWAGVVVLCIAWLGLGWRLRRVDGVRPREVTFVAALWALPLALGPALFSLDMYSYLAQGSLLHHGLNPYRVAPVALHRWHESRLLGAVSTNWRHTTAPYGPLFVALSAVAAAIAGPHLTLGVELLRLPELAGVALLAVFVPRLARALGADPVRASWLTVASPLVLLLLVGGGHNDALMAGLMVAGVAFAVERRPLAGLALCTLAATVKLPAIAAIAVIGIVWLRAEPRRWRHVLLAGGAIVAAIGLGTGIVVGVGVSWISGSLFSTPETVHLAITPSTAVAVAIWELGHGVHAGVSLAAQSVEHTATMVAFVVTGLVALGLCLRARMATLPRALGLMLVAAALGGPAAWPWYLSWGTVLLATDGEIQRSRWLPAVLVAAVFPVMAGGQVAIGLPQAPRMLAVYGLVVGIGFVAWLRGRWTVSRAAPLPAGTLRRASSEAAG